MPRDEENVRLHVIPLTFRKACEFVEKFHRHHKPPRGAKFCIGVIDETGLLRGVAMVGRPVARHMDDGLTAEVNRTCTDGCKNANSFLYAAAWRVAREMGYLRILTYTQAEESGVSLKAAGWKDVKVIAARKSWSESSVKLKGIRDPIGSGGIQRVLWEMTA